MIVDRVLWKEKVNVILYMQVTTLSSYQDVKIIPASYIERV